MKPIEKLKTKLSELFQLDQADLDFGIYRIMNSKRDEVTQFLDKDLLPQVKEAFQEYKSSDKAEIQKELDKVMEGVKAAGMDPEQSPKVQELRDRLKNEAVDVTALENEVFSHLYDFFSRYYDEGDFLSLRRYKEGVYAIPYEGEEVKLHWANADQYYIKSSEYFRDYAFKLEDGGKVHFKITEADTEKDNVKAASGEERRFVLAPDTPVSEEDGELVVRFHYIPPPKEGPSKTKQDELNSQAVETILSSESIKKWKAALEKIWKRGDGSLSEKNILEKHLNDYTKRHTFDYFIHKDLGKFLRRELDFYIKNQVMHLDDIENESAPRVEQYLSKIKVIRRIAHKITDFLAQLEDFQKKLWLKKKFVIETNYCMTLDRAPEELYPEIAANEAQREEWVKLFAIGEIEGDLHSPASSSPLTVEFLKANDKLVLDTRFFDEAFKIRLIASIENFDEQCDGLLIHSENFQALNLLQERYREQVKCVYIDPPYNTEQDRQQGKFIYKDSFESSSWLTLMGERIQSTLFLMRNDATFFDSIDHNEIASIKYLLESLFSKANFEGLISWRRRHNQPNDKTKMIGMVAEYIFSYAKNSSIYKKAGVGKLDLTGDFSNPDGDTRGDWASKPWKVGSDQSGSRYKIATPNGKVLDEEWMGEEATYKQLLMDDRIYFPKNGGGAPRKKYYKFEREEEGQCATNWWQHDQFGHNQGANDLMTSLFGYKNAFSNPKPVELIRGVLLIANSKQNYILDYFAGSGTTAHAVINLNREDNGKRKYILVEMGDYFNTVLKPRIQKVVYSEDWKEGKPTSRHTGVSHCFKYLRLESYEDALANLQLKRTQQQELLLGKSDSFRESYMLQYMLDTETRDSPSLLNIDAFEDPFNYKLLVGAGSVGETKPVTVDLVETFNYLIGLQVRYTDHIRGFRVVEGKNPEGEKVLVIWRNLEEKSNEDLDAFFKKQQIKVKEWDYKIIYVNGDNNLENLRREDETWKVRLIEEEFKRLMFDVKDI